MQQTWMEKVHKHMQTSPLRQSGPAFPGTRREQELSQVNAVIKGVLASMDKSLSVVVMGEVKAGKSTLINALAGEKVAPSDVLETTSAIMEISHSSEPLATVRYRSGKIENFAVAELFGQLEAHRGDASFFAQINQIEVGVPLPNLQDLRLVDTPGLATITDANAAVAIEYVQQADVILWVLNGQHLGQADIVDNLAGIARLGKPVLGVVNRVDQVEGSPRRLAQYAQRELAAYVEQVFPLSALQAYEAVATANAELMQESGLLQLQAFLEDHLNLKAAEVKEESALSSAEAALRLDKTLHTSYGEQISSLVRLARENRDEMKRRAWEIAEQVKRELTERVHREMYTQEYNAIQSQETVTKEMLEEAFSSKVLQAWWQGTFEEASRRLTEEWEASHAEYVQKLEEELTTLAASEEAAILATLQDGPDDIWGKTISTAAKGGVTGSATGFGLAAYAAWLGPYAASVGISSAAAALVPPVAIAGVVGGAVYGVYSHFSKGQKQHQEMLTALRGHIRKEQQTFINAFLIPKVFPAIEKSCVEQAEELHHRFLQEACAGWDLKQIAELSLAIDTYAARVDLLLQEGESLAGEVAHVAS